MGMRASADVVYGVDLGDREYGDVYVEHPDTEEWEDGLYETVSNLIDEFKVEKLGRPKVDWHADAEQREPQVAALRKWQQDFPQYQALDVDSYGYEFAGTAIVSRNAANVVYGAKPLNVDFADTNHDVLEELLVWLESKGLRFTDPAKRKPGWLLLASYG